MSKVIVERLVLVFPFNEVVRLVWVDLDFLEIICAGVFGRNPWRSVTTCRDIFRADGPDDVSYMLVLLHLDWEV